MIRAFHNPKPAKVMEWLMSSHKNTFSQNRTIKFIFHFPFSILNFMLSTYTSRMFPAIRTRQNMAHRVFLQMEKRTMKYIL